VRLTVPQRRDHSSFGSNTDRPSNTGPTAALPLPLLLPLRLGLCIGLCIGLLVLVLLGLGLGPRTPAGTRDCDTTPRAHAHWCSETRHLGQQHARD
jgi:hypothetical protein